MYFASDNWAPAAPEILAALERANVAPVPAYGRDPITQRAQERIAETFETECAVYFVATGSAANALGLACICPPYGSILCHEASHIQIDECACPEFYTGGAKLIPLAGAGAKLTPDIIAARLAVTPPAPPHLSPLCALSITQGSECGTVYTPAETADLSAAAKKAGLKVHLDGARFANAVASTGASPAALTWMAGIDVLSFGATKNGCLAAEAVVIFDRALAKEFEYRRKRGGHLLSKMRFLSAQIDAYLENNLWLKLAAHANAMARRLSDGLAAIDGVEIAYPTQINEVFAVFPDGMAPALQSAGAVFYPWVYPGDPAGARMMRFVCSFKTTPDEIDALLALARAHRT